MSSDNNPDEDQQAAEFEPLDPARRLAIVYGSEAALADVRHPTSVEAFRIDFENWKDDQTPARMHGYPITFGPVVVGTADAAALSEIFTNWTDPQVAAACFMPGVAFRFSREASVTDVLVCFQCINFCVVHGAHHSSPEPFVTRPLVPLVKRLFPDDPAIRSL